MEPALEGLKGFVSFSGVHRTLVGLIKDSADVTTLVHESGHVWRRTLEGDDLTTLERHYRVRDGVWDRRSEERFARHLERYFRDGKAPNVELRDLFSRFKSWMGAVYRTLQGSPIHAEVHPDVRGVMDRMFTHAEGVPTGRFASGRNRDAFRKSLFEASAKAGIPLEQAQDVLHLWDARARSWASRGAGRSSEEYFARYGAIHRSVAVAR